MKLAVLKIRSVVIVLLMFFFTALLYVFEDVYLSKVTL